MPRRKRITPDAAYGMTVKELRKELGRLNVAARKAVETKSKAGYKTKKLDIKPVRGLKKEELVQQVVNLNYWLRSDESKVSRLQEAEKKRIDTLNKRFGNEGLVFGKATARHFGDFMEYVKDRSPKKGFASEAAVRLFDLAERKGISMDTLKSVYGKYMASQSGLFDLYDAIEKPAKRGTDIWKIRISMGRRGLL